MWVVGWRGYNAANAVFVVFHKLSFNDSNYTIKNIKHGRKTTVTTAADINLSLCSNPGSDLILKDYSKSYIPYNQKSFIFCTTKGRCSVFNSFLLSLQVDQKFSFCLGECDGDRLAIFTSQQNLGLYQVCQIWLFFNYLKIQSWFHG